MLLSDTVGWCIISWQGERTSSSHMRQSSSRRRSKPNSSKQLGNVKKVSSPLTASRHSPAGSTKRQTTQSIDSLQVAILQSYA